MKKTYTIPLTLSLLFLTSCHVSSKVAVEGRGGRTSYNETLQKTTNEEMLLNLVRLRYVDFPFFLDVNAITTQFSFGSKIQPVFPIPGFNEENATKIGAELSWQNTPTISYTPLQGQTFALQLFRPIDLIIIQQLIYGGWDVDRVFRICVQSMNDILNAPTASGPMPDFQPQFENFIKVSKLLRYFQQREQLQVSIKLNEPGKVYKGAGLGISFPTGSELSEQLQDLMPGGDRENGYYNLEVEMGFTKNRNIGIMPRSLLACMYYLSLGVEVPNSIDEQKCIPCTHTEEGHDFDWKDVVGDLLSVKSSKSKPANAFISVKYRNYWFYIDEHDLQSKRTFVLLLQLYNLQSSPTTATGPVLTLPLG